MTTEPTHKAGVYRKRPVEIRAVQLPPEGGSWVTDFGETLMPNWFSVAAALGVATWATDAAGVQIDGLFIHTLEGVHHALPGDWIIQGVKGELYPIKDEIFRLTYEPATEPATDLVETVQNVLDEHLWPVLGGPADFTPAIITALAPHMKAIRDAALDEAAGLADALSDELHRQWRADHKSSSYLEGKSDGTEEAARAILTLKDKP